MKNNEESIEVIIQKAILDGTLKPGQSVTEEWLCKYLKVSRTRVREALIRLDSGGIIRIVKNKGAFIREITPVDIIEIFELRILLESHAAMLCAQFLDEKALTSLLEEFHQASQDNGQDQKKIDLGVKLHDLVIDSAGNRRLKKLVEMLTTQIFWVRSFATMVPGRVQRSFQDHLSLIEALVEKDQLKAEETMRGHLTSTRDEMLDPSNMHIYTIMFR